MFVFFLFIASSVYAGNPTSVSSEESVTAQSADSIAAKKNPTQSDSIIQKQFFSEQDKKKRFFPKEYFISVGYNSSSTIDINIGIFLMGPFSFDIHTQLNFSDDFQTVSDDALLEIGGVFGAIFLISIVSNTDTKGVTLISLAVLSVPLFIYCGTFYLPIVPGSWLGFVDKSHMVTQLISEGFHKRSFTYTNDIGLRLAPTASMDLSIQGFVDGGIRFEKNFASKPKLHFVIQAGLSF